MLRPTIMEILDKILLQEYIDAFYGYGNWNSKFWFVGIEEGGDSNIVNIQKRLDSWNRYKSDLIDIKQHHDFIGLDGFFTTGKYQYTWRKLILTKLKFDGLIPDRDNAIKLQIDNWGQNNSENLLIELFPLSSPNNSMWNYGEWTEIAYLKTRNSYYDEISNNRVVYIKNKILDHKPEVVLFYGTKMSNYWNQIIGDDDLSEMQIHKSKIKFKHKDGTLYIKSPHPAAVYSNIFWIGLGHEIRKLLYNANIISIS